MALELSLEPWVALAYVVDLELVGSGLKIFG